LVHNIAAKVQLATEWPKPHITLPAGPNAIFKEGDFVHDFIKELSGQHKAGRFLTLYRTQEKNHAFNHLCGDNMAEHTTADHICVMGALKNIKNMFLDDTAPSQKRKAASSSQKDKADDDDHIHDPMNDKLSSLVQWLCTSRRFENKLEDINSPLCLQKVRLATNHVELILFHMKYTNSHKKRKINTSFAKPTTVSNSTKMFPAWCGVTLKLLNEIGIMGSANISCSFCTDLVQQAKKSMTDAVNTMKDNMTSIQS
jgi:hypothetical protein